MRVETQTTITMTLQEFRESMNKSITCPQCDCKLLELSEYEFEGYVCANCGNPYPYVI
jgi:hypothetical protein